MAFWFTEERFVPGIPSMVSYLFLGTAFGYKENFKGLGIFFDVFKNHVTHLPHPYISAMVGDGVKKYDHHTDGQEFGIGGCHKQTMNTNHPVQARVTYDQNILELMLKIEEGDWETCFRAPNVHLPKSGYIGFTAATGGLSARHDLLAVTTAVIERDPGPAFADQIHEHADSPLPALMFIFLVSGVAATGYYAYQNRKRHHF
jgi:mannose-binding lectin 2